MVAAVLLLTPLAVYWPTVFHEYGYRDDYAHLRETRESPELLLRFTSSYARPIYGTLLIATVRWLGGVVENLQWLRLGSALLLGVLGVTLWRLLVRSGWSAIDAATVGLVITVLPAAQVVVGWSIAWPIVLALLLALAGYRATEAALAARGRKRVAIWLGAGAAYAACGLIYQPCALFFVVPLGAALLRRDDAVRSRAIWAGAHVATAFAGLVTAFGVMEIVFALELAPQASVFAVERDPFAKLLWFLSQPFANALALFALRDRFDTSAVFWFAAAATVAVIATGLLSRRNRDVADRWSLSCVLLLLPFVGHAINLVATVRVPSYRTTFAIAGLVVVLVVYALRELHAAGRLKRAVHHAALGALALTGAVLASRHAYELIALPQGFEWAIVRDAVRSLELRANTRVYMIRPALEDRATRRVFADEFGSLSSNSDWAAAEMFKSALRLRFPQGLPAGLSYTLTSGLEVPRHGSFDVVIDMRRLREHRRD